jgi:hypothetical protein
MLWLEQFMIFPIIKNKNNVMICVTVRDKLNPKGSYQAQLK